MDQSCAQTFAKYVPGSPHGPVHIISGGTFNCEGSYDKLVNMGLDSDVVDTMRRTSFMSMKNLYRCVVR
jgi:hypothetical protein